MTFGCLLVSLIICLQNASIMLEYGIIVLCIMLKIIYLTPSACVEDLSVQRIKFTKDKYTYTVYTQEQYNICYSYCA